MRISLNTIKQYVNIPENIPDQDLIDLIGSRLVEIEEVIDLAPRYEGVYVAKVISAEPIPDTHLHLCQIDAGAARPDLAKDGKIQVVCGAPNVHAGMLAVWIMPGAIVPATYGNENFKLGVRRLRGFESNGMLAGADELGFDTEHESIAEIDPALAEPGELLSEIFGLDDIILDVENKSLTHRPDCFGLIGFAREVAGILGVPFTEPTVFQNLSPKLHASSELQLEVEIQDTDLCPRYSCAVFDLPKNTPSKYLTAEAIFLAKAGMRAIDPIVDLTNILMLETGQPLHAFDYDKLVAVGRADRPKIIIRAAEPGETLQLLDGKTIECITDDILITSNNVPVALAGAMGGKNTEVDLSTKRIILESATFSLYRLRKTQMAHGIFSEAITRFTKGQPAAMTLAVLAAALHELQVDPLAVIDDYPGKSPANVVKITTLSINTLLGTDYPTSTISQALENVGFQVKAQDDELRITVPVWRTDIHPPEDIIEEVGRLLGYDSIPLSLPVHSFSGTEIDPIFSLKSQLRNILSDRLAMHELITYSFVSRRLLEKAGLDPVDCYEITNSISPELECFRSQIAPSLLDKTRDNLKAGHRDFTLYEMNQVSQKSYGLTDEGTPTLQTHLTITTLADFYHLKAAVLALFAQLKIKLEYTALSAEAAKQYPYLEPKRSAELQINGRRIGAFGELRHSIATNFKLDLMVSACEISLDPLIDAPHQLSVDLHLSRFPSVERDLTLKVSADIAFGRVDQALEESLSRQGIYYTLSPLSIYQASPTADTKNLSFHLRFSRPDKTLDSTEISAIIDTIAKDLAAVGATIV